MVETRHIKFDYEEALSGKKQILSSELDLLHILKSLKTYGILRKKEFITKTKLKASVTALKTKINYIQASFPEEIIEEKQEPLPRIRTIQQAPRNIVPRPIKITPTIKRPKVEKKTNLGIDSGIQKELESIKARLERLQ